MIGQLTLLLFINFYLNSYCQVGAQDGTKTIKQHSNLKLEFFYISLQAKGFSCKI